MIELNGESYLNGHEASNLLGIKLTTLYTYVSRGVLKSYKQGIKRQSLYKQADLEALLRLHSSDDVMPSPAHDSADIRRASELPHAEDWVPDI
jgi:excisionase family DNA binding protein